MKLSGMKHLVEEYGSSLVETEVTFDELKLTAKLIREYLKLTPTQHIDYASDEDNYLSLIIQQYGIGNYEEAKKDLDEFSVLFN
jgi:hypothetical protein